MIIRILTTILLFATLATPLAAKKLVRSTTQIEQLPVQGITLAMTPKEAFETLHSAGFKAGDLSNYEDWDSDGVEFVRGKYGSPSGHSSVSFSRGSVGSRPASRTISSVTEAEEMPQTPRASAATTSSERPRALPTCPGPMPR